MRNFNTEIRWRDLDEDDEPRSGRWFHLGTEAACAMLERHGFEVIDPDVGVVHRDPVIHFRKP